MIFRCRLNKLREENKELKNEVSVVEADLEEKSKKLAQAELQVRKLSTLVKKFFCFENQRKDTFSSCLDYPLSLGSTI